MGMLDNKNGTLIQYDGEAQSIAGKNVIEAFEGSDTVIFNETYLVIGAHTEALKIHAMYDLTIIGDITVSSLRRTPSRCTRKDYVLRIELNL